jgi:hypothetical protein
MQLTNSTEILQDVCIYVQVTYNVNNQTRSGVEVMRVELQTKAVDAAGAFQASG